MTETWTKKPQQSLSFGTHSLSKHPLQQCRILQTVWKDVELVQSISTLTNGGFYSTTRFFFLDKNYKQRTFLNFDRLQEKSRLGSCPGNSVFETLVIRSGSIPTSLRLSKDCEGIDMGEV